MSDRGEPMTEPPNFPGWGPPAAAPKPGVIPLRPLGIGEILDGAISYVRANPKVTLGLAAIVTSLSELVQAPATVLMANMQPTRSLRETMAGTLGATIFAVLVSFVVGTILNGLLISVLARAVLGQRPSMREVWAATRPRLLGLLGVVLLLGLAACGLVLLAVVPLVGLAALDPPHAVAVPVGVLWALGALVALVYLMMRWVMAAPVYVLEPGTVPGALVRSARLVRGQWWRVFGIVLLAQLIAVVLSMILSVPFTLAGMLASGGFTQAFDGVGVPLPMLLLSTVGTILATTVTAPFIAGVTGLLYIDQRIRREGLDLELARMAQARPDE